jgi:periplasmic protein TonB
MKMNGPAEANSTGNPRQKEGGASAGSVETTGTPGGASLARSAVNGSISAEPKNTIHGRQPYQARLESLVAAHQKYPLAARKLGREGSCRRLIVLDRDGTLKRVEELSSCGHPFLDSAATRAITDVGRFPPFPKEYQGNEGKFSITIGITLAER